MGVTYKLKEEIVQHIIQLRQANALLSCRALAEAVEAQFGVHVSKSSVHEVLKEAHFTSSRGRKPKDVFSIPLEKKKIIQESLSKALAPLTPTDLPVVEERRQRDADRRAVAPPVEEIASPVARNDKSVVSNDRRFVSNGKLKSFARREIPVNAGEIFIKAAFWDLCGEKVLGIKGFDDISSARLSQLEMAWDYLISEAGAIKVNLQDGHTYYIGLRNGILSSSCEGFAGMPIERATREAVDAIVNNKQPLIVRGVSEVAQGVVLEDFLESMAGVEGKKITNIEIVDQEDHKFAIFDSIVYKNMYFILKSKHVVDSCEKLSSLRCVTIGDDKLRTNMMEDVTDKWVIEMYGEENGFSVGLSDEKCLSSRQKHSGMAGELGSLLPSEWLMIKLKERAQSLFAPQLMQESWAQVLAFGGAEEGKNDIRDVSLFISDSYENYQDVLIAAKRLNSMAIRDEAGFKILLKILAPSG